MVHIQKVTVHPGPSAHSTPPGNVTSAKPAALSSCAVRSARRRSPGEVVATSKRLMAKSFRVPHAKGPKDPNMGKLRFLDYELYSQFGVCIYIHNYIDTF